MQTHAFLCIIHDSSVLPAMTLHGVQSSPIAHALQTIGMHGALGAGKCVESYKEYSASNNIKSPTLPPYWGRGGGGGGGRLTGRGA